MLEKDMYILKRVKLTVFEYSFIGIVSHSSIDWYDYTLTLIDGSEMMFSKSQLEEVSIVRGIDKEIRELMNDYGKKKKRRDKKIIEVESKLKELNKEAKMEISQTKEELLNISGLIDKDEFQKELMEHLRSKMKDPFYSYVIYNPNASILDISISKNIEKYAQPSNHSFLYFEYDGTLHINPDSRYYYEELSKHDSIKPLNNTVRTLETRFGCNMSISSDLYVGDKNWLTYGLDIKVKFEDKLEPTKENLENCKKILDFLY